MKPYKRNGRLFRYNPESCTVEYVEKMDEHMLEIEAEWKKKHSGSFWGADAEGYVVLASAGLDKERWANKEIRNDYLDAWGYVIDWALEYEVTEFEMH